MALQVPVDTVFDASGETKASERPA